jgi:hypothetical protein
MNDISHPCIETSLERFNFLKQNSAGGMAMDVAEGTGSHVTKFFSWLDFLVFGAMLCLSALIGVYFGFFAKKKQNTTTEYLMGGKTMGIFPISMSLIARYVETVVFKNEASRKFTHAT